MFEQEVQSCHVLPLVLMLVMVAPWKVALMVAGLGSAEMLASAPWDCLNPAYSAPKENRRAEAVYVPQSYLAPRAVAVVHDLVVERKWRLQVQLPVFLEMGSQLQTPLGSQ